MLCLNTALRNTLGKCSLGVTKNASVAFLPRARCATPFKTPNLTIYRAYNNWSGGDSNLSRHLRDMKWAYERYLRRWNILYIIIGVNVVIFLLWQTIGSSRQGRKLMLDNFTSSIKQIQEGRIWTLLTSAFSHYNLPHLLFNMMGLYFLGQSVYYTIGPARFFHLYLAGGIASTMATLLLHKLKGAENPRSRAHWENVGVLGASGSVMSIVTLFGALFPKQQVYIYFVLPVPAIALVGLYIMADVWGLSQSSSSGVSNIGHLAGALVGGAYFYYNVRRGRIARTW